MESITPSSINLLQFGSLESVFSLQDCSYGVVVRVTDIQS